MDPFKRIEMSFIQALPMTTGEFSQPALFNCKRGPDGSIVSEAVVGSAGIEPAIFAM
jgi:hypothetical protein